MPESPVTAEDPLERLRAALIAYAQTQPRFRVTTERSTQFSFDDDTDAFAAIAVIDHEQPDRLSVPVLVVDREAPHRDILSRIWLSFGTEVWLIDSARRSIRISEPRERDARLARSLRGGAKLVIAKAVAKTECLPGFHVDVPRLFGA